MEKLFYSIGCGHSIFKNGSILGSSFIAQLVKNPSANAGDIEMQVWSLGGKIPLEKEMTTHSSILAWRIPRTEEPGRVQSMGVARVGHDLATTLQNYYPCQGGQMCFKQPTNSNMNPLQKHPHRHTQNNVWPNVRSPLGLVKLTHKVNHHRSILGAWDLATGTAEKFQPP